MAREVLWFDGHPVELATTDEAEGRREGELALAGETLVVKIWPKAGDGSGDPKAAMRGEPLRSRVVYATQPVVESTDADRFKWNDDPNLKAWLETQLRSICADADGRTRSA